MTITTDRHGHAEPRALARQHLVPHFTSASAWREDDLFVPVRGEATHLWDAEGRRYLDGLSGLFCTNLGHGRVDVIDAMADQLRQLAFMPNWGLAHPAATDAAEAITRVGPVGLDRAFFVNSGSEAVESAIKLARAFHLANGEADRYKVLARDWAYHGTTIGALAVTGVPRMQAPFAPLLGDWVRRVPNTYGSTVPPGGTAADLPAVRAVEEAILAEGPETISLLIAEPVQNGRGAVVPPPGYWPELRRLCDRYGILLCADEVICGFGRLGHWFGSDRFGVVPDLVTFAKAATSGYAPLGGVLSTAAIVEAVYDSPMRGFVHGSTFGGHPVAAAAVVATIEAMEREQTPARVLSLEPYLSDRLTDLVAGHDHVLEYRGCGFFYALELTGSRARGEALHPEAAAQLLGGGVLAKLIRTAGLHIRPDDRGATMLVVAPPLVSETADLEELVDGLDRVLDGVRAHLAGLGAVSS